MSAEAAIITAILLPMAGAILIVAAGRRRPNLREAVTLATAGLLFVTVLTLTAGVFGGARPEISILEIFPGIALGFTVEPLGMLFALIASALWIVNSIYSIGYMRGNNEKNQTRYYVYFAIALASTMGIAFAGNMFTLFTFYEALTICTFPLVTHNGGDRAMKAGRTYMGLLLGTSIGFQLLGIVWTWWIAGTLDFTQGGILAGKASAPVAGILLFLYIFGIGKAALMPVHRWLPAAMVAPAPVSALLHAVAVVKAGVFTVVKVVIYIFGVDFLAAGVSTGWLLYVAGFTVLAASVIALRSDNLKRRLAYSTISQLSYIVLATAILAPLSIIGAALHIAAHAVAKITLFFAAGSIYTAAHKTEVSELDGIGRRMPWTMGAFAIASLSIIGVPPTIGFVSKWFILLGALEVQQTFAVVVIIVSTLLNAGYFMPIVYAAFFKKEAAEGGPGGGAIHDHGEAPLAMVIALTATAAATVILFFFADQIIALVRQLIVAP